MSGGNKRIVKGVVLESKMDKTAVVQVTRKIAHPVYKKYITTRKKYYAHDEQNRCMPGDEVRIIESRPLSKLKRWRVLEIDKTANEI